MALISHEPLLEDLCIIGVKASVGLQLACKCLLANGKVEQSTKQPGADADDREISKHFKDSLSNKE